MENRSLVTIAEHSKEKILYMIEMAKQFEARPNRRLLEGKVVATLFFEPSTRTRLSFETAANRLGARVIGFSDPKATSSSKGETLKDTIKMVSNYADIIVMRHHLEGAARYASEVTTVPIVNAGDGANQHPSQTIGTVVTSLASSGRSSPLCQRSNHSAYRQCRRRSQPASFTNDARPLLHLQNPGYTGEPEYFPRW